MERLHVDLCDYKGKHILIMIDAFSKYIWANFVDGSMFEILTMLSDWISDNAAGPATIVTANKPQFSSEFTAHLARRGINHTIAPSYHPVSNCLARTAVCYVKDNLQKLATNTPTADLYRSLAAVLHRYRVTPLPSTGHMPYQLICSISA